MLRAMLTAALLLASPVFAAAAPQHKSSVHKCFIDEGNGRKTPCDAMAKTEHPKAEHKATKVAPTTVVHVHQSYGVVCDTPDEVAVVLSLTDDEMPVEQMLAEINRRAQHVACALDVWFYTFDEDKPIGPTYTDKNGSVWQMLPITIYAYQSKGKDPTPIHPPKSSWSGFLQKPDNASPSNSLPNNSEAPRFHNINTKWR